MSKFETNPPGLEPLNSAIIGRVTDQEREFVRQMAALWEMSVSAYVRFAVLRYSQTVLDRAADMTAADVAIEESRALAAIEARAKAEAASE